MVTLKKTDDVTDKLCFVHLPGKADVIKTFLDVNSALDFAEKQHIQLSCDPLHVLIRNAEVKVIGKGIEKENEMGIK